MDNKDMEKENKAKESCGKSSGKKCTPKKEDLLLDAERFVSVGKFSYLSPLAIKDSDYLHSREIFGEKGVDIGCSVLNSSVRAS